MNLKMEKKKTYSKKVLRMIVQLYARNVKIVKTEVKI